MGLLKMYLKYEILKFLRHYFEDHKQDCCQISKQITSTSLAPCGLKNHINLLNF